MRLYVDKGEPKLKRYMLENQIKFDDVSNFLEIAKTTFSLKINQNEHTFTKAEKIAICVFLNQPYHMLFEGSIEL